MTLQTYQGKTMTDFDMKSYHFYIKEVNHLYLRLEAHSEEEARKESLKKEEERKKAARVELRRAVESRRACGWRAAAIEAANEAMRAGPKGWERPPAPPKPPLVAEE